MPISYPKGEPEIAAIKITLAPSDVMPFHCHPMLTVGYVLSGALMVEKMSGESHVFHAGDTINEVVGSWHRGKNMSDKEKVELVGFYIGAKGMPTMIPHIEDSHADECK